MGQYYRPILGDAYGLNCMVFDRSVDGEYTLAKLMEHSWWLNPFVNSFAAQIYNSKSRVCWVLNQLTLNLPTIQLSTYRTTKKFGEIKLSYLRHIAQILRWTENSCLITTRKNISTWTSTKGSRKTKTVGRFTLYPCLPLSEIIVAVEIFTKVISVMNL